MPQDRPFNFLQYLHQSSGISVQLFFLAEILNNVNHTVPPKADGAPAKPTGRPEPAHGARRAVLGAKRGTGRFDGSAASPPVADAVRRGPRPGELDNAGRAPAGPSRDPGRGGRARGD